MNRVRITRSFAVGCFLALALLTAGFSYASLAQSASRMAVMGSGVADCSSAKASVASVKQGDRFAVDVQGLAAEEPLYLTVIFEDGRVFSPTVASIDGPGGLDGALDQPDDPGFLALTNSGGDYATFLQTTAKWPIGCHRVIAQGVVSQIQVDDYVDVQPAAPPVASGGPLSLIAQSRTGQKPAGEQGVVVDIFGRLFMSGETVQLRMVQPNGTVVELPQEVQADGTIIRPNLPEVSTVGSFQIAVTLGTTYQEGDYTIIASSGNGQSISAPFTLRRQTLKPRGFGLLNIANPAAPAPASQGQTIQLQGRLFTAGETVELSLIQGNGVTRPLAVVQTNQLGEFTADLPLGRQLPVGQHQLLAVSATTLVTRSLQLNLGLPVVPQEALLGLAGPRDGLSGGLGMAPAPSAVMAPTSPSAEAPTPFTMMTAPAAPAETATPVPSSSADGHPSTSAPTGYSPDPCGCGVGFSAGLDPALRPPSHLVPITSEPPSPEPPVLPTPSF